MKHIIIVSAILLGMPVAVSGQQHKQRIKQTDNTDTRFTTSVEYRTIKRFNKIEVGDGIRLRLMKGDINASVETYDLMMPYVELVNSGETLIVRIAASHDTSRMPDATVNITTPGFDYLKITSGASASIDPSLKFGALRIDIASAGSCTGEVVAGSCLLDIASAGRFEGRIDASLDVEVNISSSASYSGVLLCRNLGLSLSSSSSATINGRCEKCTLQASGGSSVKSPQMACGEIHASLSGGSWLECTAYDVVQMAVSGGSKATLSDKKGIKKNYPAKQ